MPGFYVADRVETKEVEGKMVNDTVFHRVSDLVLVNQLGKQVSINNDLKDKILVINFFFTSCPTICPKLTGNIQMLQRAFKKDPKKEFVIGNEIQFLSLTVNPERDSFQVLRAYADQYDIDHDRWWLLTGDKQTIYQFAREQINVARGEKLSFTQDDLKINGHSIELRVCAEDPMNNFLPDTGRLEMYQPPKGPGVRVDDGYEQGQDIPIFYDPLLAKLVVHAATREEAIERLCRAVDEYYIQGIQTTLSFGKWAVRTEPFRTGNFDTKFIEKYFKPELLLAHDPETEEVAALLSSFVWEKERGQKASLGVALSSGSGTGWKNRRR